MANRSAKRTTLAGIPIGKDDELVLSLDAHDKLDIRISTLTGGGTYSGATQ